jgi:hypothetical protein
MRAVPRNSAVTCRPPARGIYAVEWAANELIQCRRLAGRALCLWLQLKGLAWSSGRCDPTDAMLRSLLGGASRDTLRRARRRLHELGLLYEYRDAGRRWLVPLPISPARRRHFPAAVWQDLLRAAAAGDAQAQPARGLPRPPSKGGLGQGPGRGKAPVQVVPVEGSQRSAGNGDARDQGDAVARRQP